MNKNNPEVRHYGQAPELRAEGENSRIIEGYALLFERESQVLGGDDGFIEVISKEALQGADLTDVVARKNHDNNYVLARTTAKTLTLSIDEKGLKYRFEAPNTTVGNDLLEDVRIKNIEGSSFAFSIADGGDKWEKRDGKFFRTITKFKRIYDVAPVVEPAYKDTDVKIAKRSIDQMKEESTQPAAVDLDIMEQNLELLKIKG